MKFYIFAVVTTVLLISMVFQLPSKATDIGTIDTMFEWFGWSEDINHDGRINYLDASNLTYHYGWTGPVGGPGEYRWDINDDGVVNALDVSRMVMKYRQFWLIP